MSRPESSGPARSAARCGPLWWVEDRLFSFSLSRLQILGFLIVEASCFFCKFQKKKVLALYGYGSEFNNFKSCCFSEPADSVICLQLKPIFMFPLTRCFFGWVHVTSKQVTCCGNVLLQMKGAATNVASVLSIACSISIFEASTLLSLFHLKFHLL